MAPPSRDDARAGGKPGPVEEQALPLYAERLDVTRRRREVAAVQVTLRTAERQELVDELLQSEDVEVERRPVQQIVDEAPPVRQEGDVTVIPVVEEVLVVERRILLKEEIRLKRTTRHRRYQEMVVLRSEEVAVERLDPPLVEEDPHKETETNSMSTETIVAVFDTAMRAEKAIHDLLAEGVPSRAIEQYAQEEQPAQHEQPAYGGPATPAAADLNAGTAEPETEVHGRRGFWGWLTGAEDPAHEHHALYDRSVRSGSIVVTVIADATDVGRIEDILQRHDPIDLDERPAPSHAEGLYGDEPGATSAAASGFAAGPAAVPPYPAEHVSTTGSADLSGRQPVTGSESARADATTERGYAGATTGGEFAGDRGGTAPVAQPATTATPSDAAAGRATATRQSGAGTTEEVIPLAAESLSVGKRDVERGTTRVRRYVVERPVEEQIRLRDERVSVFRRPVQAAGAVAADAFTDREITVTETDEEAVVGKTAQVVEEVVVQKSVEERAETVRDTLRRDEVEVDGPAGRDAATGPATRRD